VFYRALGKREYAGFLGFFAVSLTARGRAAGVLSVLFAADPLKQDVEQEVTSQNAKGEEYRKRH
jgi:hypothetical protein